MSRSSIHPTPEEIEAWVEATCEEQGVPVKVTDPDIIRRVAILLGTPESRPT